MAANRDDGTPRNVDPKRSATMRAIRREGTDVELAMRAALRKAGLRYRKNVKTLPGSPDVVLPKHGIAIFCDSEFFHGKDLEETLARLSKGSNPEYWTKKIARNARRDLENERDLRGMGWTVLRFWRDDVLRDPDACAAAVLEAIAEKRIGDGDDGPILEPDFRDV